MSGRNHVVLALALIAGSSCSGVPFTAPKDAKMTISANPDTIPITNGTAIITVTVTEASGTPVADGTHISFTTTLGAITADVETRSGVARATLSSTGVAGDAKVKAFSGAGASNETTVKIGVAATSIALSATPASLGSGGGTVQLSATVFGANGSPVQGAAVVFSTTQGTLASGGAPVTTDASGRATDTLTTSRTAEVTATSGSNSSKVTVTVGTTDIQNIILSASKVNIQKGETVDLVAVVMGSNGPIPGVAVAWSTTAGSLGNPGITFTDGDGVAVNSLTTDSSATVTAAAAGKSATLAITVGSGVQSVHVAISAERSSIINVLAPDGTCGSTGTQIPVSLYAHITDDTGTPVPDGREVLFYVDFSAFDKCALAFGEFCGGSGRVVSAPTVNGVATVEYNMTQADICFCNCLVSGSKCMSTTLCQGNPNCSGATCPSTATCDATSSPQKDQYCSVSIVAVSGGIASTNVQTIEYGN